MKTNLTVEQAAYESFTSFINEYYFHSKIEDYGLFLNLNFWDQAEIYEIVIDAYEHTGDKRYYDLIGEIFRGFQKTQGEDWAWNEFNDDIMWITIGCVRAYNATGDEVFLETAKKHFQLVWDRAWSEDLGGGLFWRIENTTKNACINCPAAIAACLLGEALDDESYYEKAELIMDWVVANIYEEDTGHVYDAYEMNGNKNPWASTYNQGTFIGANTLLYVHTHKGVFLSRARRAADYTMEEMYHGGVMNNEDNSGDLVGFKGILARWMYSFSTYCNQPDVMEWMKKNAMTAWSNRNSKGIMITTWDKKTPEEMKIMPFSASTAVSALNNCKENCKTALNGTEFSGADRFTRCGRLLINSTEDGKLSLDVLAQGAYLEYACVNGLEGQTKLKLKATAKEETSFEVHLGAPDGELLGSGTIGDGEEVLIELKEGSDAKNLYFVFPEVKEGIEISGFQFVS